MGQTEKGLRGEGWLTILPLPVIRHTHMLTTTPACAQPPTRFQGEIQLLTGSGKVKPALMDIAEIARTKQLLDDQAAKHREHDNKWRDAGNRPQQEGRRGSKHKTFQTAHQYSPMGSFAGH